MKCVIALAALVAASCAASTAFAQSSGYPYCLMTGSAEECAYTSVAQCQAAKRGNTDFCEPNNTYSPHRGRSEAPQ
jgi:hypothetical protein